MNKRRALSLLDVYGPHAKGKAPWRTIVSMVMERWERWSEDDFDDPKDQRDWQYLYNAAYAIGWGLDTGRFPVEIEKKLTSMRAEKLLSFVASVASKARTINDAKEEIRSRLSEQHEQTQQQLVERLEMLETRRGPGAKGGCYKPA